MKRLLIPFLALALCPPVQAAMVTWKRTHNHQKAYKSLPATDTVTTHSIDPNTATRVGDVMIVGSYEVEYYKTWNRSLDQGRTHTIYANCSSGELVIEHDPPYTWSKTYIAEKPNAWREVQGKWSTVHDDESWERKIEMAENRGSNAAKHWRIGTPLHKANSTVYALLCQDTPPQHKEIKGTHLSLIPSE